MRRVGQIRLTYQQLTVLLRLRRCRVVSVVQDARERMTRECTLLVEGAGLPQCPEGETPQLVDLSTLGVIDQ